MAITHQNESKMTMAIVAGLLFLGIAILTGFSSEPSVEEKAPPPEGTDQKPGLTVAKDDGDPAREQQLLEKLRIKRLTWKGTPPNGQPRIDFALAGYESLRKLYMIMALFEDVCDASIDRFPVSDPAVQAFWLQQRHNYLRSRYTRLWGSYYELSSELRTGMQRSMAYHLKHGIEHNGHRCKLNTKTEFHILDSMILAQLRSPENKQRMGTYKLQVRRVWVKDFVLDGERVNPAEQVSKPIEEDLLVALDIARTSKLVPEPFEGILRGLDMPSDKAIIDEAARWQAAKDSRDAYAKAQLFLRLWKEEYSRFEELIRLTETVRQGGHKHHDIDFTTLMVLTPPRQDQAVGEEQNGDRVEWKKSKDFHKALYLWESTFNRIGSFLQQSGIGKEKIESVLDKYVEDNRKHPAIDTITQFKDSFLDRYQDNILAE